MDQPNVTVVKILPLKYLVWHNGDPARRLRPRQCELLFEFNFTEIPREDRKVKLVAIEKALETAFTNIWGEPAQVMPVGEVELYPEDRKPAPKPSA